MTELSEWLTNRIQLSSDALKAYVDATEQAFGPDVDYGQAVNFVMRRLPPTDSLFVLTNGLELAVAKVDTALGDPGRVVRRAVVRVIATQIGGRCLSWEWRRMGHPDRH